MEGPRLGRGGRGAACREGESGEREGLEKGGRGARARERERGGNSLIGALGPVNHGERERVRERERAKSQKDIILSKYLHYAKVN